MKSRLVVLTIAVAALLLGQTGSGPKFTPDGKLEYPTDYREWVFLSAGKGMTYGPSANPNGPPMFDNVFVKPESYREFLKSGKWPEGTTFVLEIRRAVTEGSINKGGQFQSELARIEVEVKDSKRFAATNGWGFFDGDKDRKPTAQLPATATCYGCHSQNGAVEQTFVQFYPTLIEVAKSHGTFRAERAK